MTFEPRAILFDFGGVILSSPLDGFHAYEERLQLPKGFIASLNMHDPDTNAWACMERGEIDAAEFYRRFETEALKRGYIIEARVLLSQISGNLRPEMVGVVRALKKRYRVACVTNNMNLGFGTAMSSTPEAAAEIAIVMALFDHVIESWKIRARKPEPQFFERACAIIDVAPEHCVYLDDFGMNLKPARAMGMQTIKVGDPAQAVADLEALLGHEVSS